MEKWSHSDPEQDKFDTANLFNGPGALENPPPPGGGGGGKRL